MSSLGRLFRQTYSLHQENMANLELKGEETKVPPQFALMCPSYLLNGRRYVNLKTRMVELEIFVRVLKLRLQC